MAIFDAVLIGGQGPTGKYKAFCERKEDMEDPAAEAWAEGSAVVCLNLDTDSTGQSPSVHVRLPDGSWSGIADNAEEVAGDG